LTTPETAFRFEHPVSVPPVEENKLIVAVDEVTTLPFNSTFIKGWVDMSCPDGPATGDGDTNTSDAGAAETVKELLVADGRDPSVAVRV
jgi:hypothetical protein